MSKMLIKTPAIIYYYPFPIVLVSCVDGAGKPNIITIGASSVCSARPPTVGIAVGVRQYSLGLINATRDFGVNLPRAEHLWQTDYCGCVSGRTTNKFEAVKFTPQPASKIASPLIQECPVSMECKLLHTLHLGDHDWLVGEIVAVHLEEEVLDGRGRLDFTRLDPIFSFYGEYWNVGRKLEDWEFAV